MRTHLTERVARCGALSLSLLSLGSFWVLPVAPLIALAANSATKNSNGCARTFAVSAAILCSVYTLGLAVVFGMMVASTLAS